jgi:hypothetical protein
LVCDELLDYRKTCFARSLAAVVNFRGWLLGFISMERVAGRVWFAKKGGLGNKAR